jgi:hypothetical protein
MYIYTVSMYFKIQATAYNIFTLMLCLCTTKMSHIAYFIDLRNYSDKMLFTKKTKKVENISKDIQKIFFKLYPNFNTENRAICK